jgi:hypothetical protein
LWGAQIGEESENILSDWAVTKPGEFYSASAKVTRKKPAGS